MKRILRPTLALSILLSVSFTSEAGIWDDGDPAIGEETFNTYCVTCHEWGRAKSAPALKGLQDRWGSTDEMLIKWIQSPSAARATGDQYVNDMYNQYKDQYADMTAQPVSVEDIANILAFVKVGPAPDDGGGGEAVSACPTIDDMPTQDEDSAGIWFLVLGVLFLIILLSSAGINRSLKNAIRERDGQEPLPHMTYSQLARKWAWDNIVPVSLVGLFATITFLVVLYQAGMDIAVVEGYQPDQPIAFSHAVHVCENEVDCEYCHHSARKSKHAGIPSTNVCMNCHKDIQKGPKTGEEEIAKIYDAIGFDPSTSQYIEGYEEKPVKWNKVHNLPDHVFFSHAQHVEVGGLDCKNCHGAVQTFTVGRVSPVAETNAQEDVPGLIKLSKPTLTMGWCIECHNKAKIDDSNEYYVEMHDRMVSTERGREELRMIMEDDAKTVKEFGGWECAKCHY